MKFLFFLHYSILYLGIELVFETQNQNVNKSLSTINVPVDK